MEVLESKIIEINHLREAKGRFVLKCNQHELETFFNHIIKDAKPKEIRYIKSDLIYGQGHKEKDYIIYF